MKPTPDDNNKNYVGVNPKAAMASQKKMDFEDYKKILEEAERLKNLEIVKKFKVKIKTDRPVVCSDKKKRQPLDNNWKPKLAVEQPSSPKKEEVMCSDIEDKYRIENEALREEYNQKLIICEEKLTAEDLEERISDLNVQQIVDDNTGMIREETERNLKNALETKIMIENDSILNLRINKDISEEFRRMMRIENERNMREEMDMSMKEARENVVRDENAKKIKQENETRRKTENDRKVTLEISRKLAVERTAKKLFTAPKRNMEQLMPSVPTPIFFRTISKPVKQAILPKA